MQGLFVGLVEVVGFVTHRIYLVAHGLNLPSPAPSPPVSRTEGLSADKAAASLSPKSFAGADSLEEVER